MNTVESLWAACFESSISSGLLYLRLGDAMYFLERKFVDLARSGNFVYLTFSALIHKSLLLKFKFFISREVSDLLIKINRILLNFLIKFAKLLKFFQIISYLLRFPRAELQANVLQFFATTFRFKV